MRCVNIDWLEVSCEESNDRYPMNADYFREHGYFVHERDYGTRVWSQVFTIEDDQGHDWIEVRREPPSGTSDFKGLTQLSCRLRLVNAQCYVKDCVQKLRDFMLKHDYIFKKIFRIDICYDFEYFDYGDQPARIARRILERRYRKINQCKLRAIGDDNWTGFEWESLSWGSVTSMVSTKMYNKSKELKTVSKEKVYIPLAWYYCGLIDHPLTRMKTKEDGSTYEPEIWRVEFSMKSKADRWLVIESQAGKRMKKEKIPHTLSMFDTPDKLWQRFQDLAYHYFHFKVARFKEESKSITGIAIGKIRDKSEWTPIRKDLCPDKKLFRFDKDHQFMQLDMAVSAAKPDNELEILIRRLTWYRNTHADIKIRELADGLIDVLKNEDLRRYTPRHLFVETEALRRALAIKMKHPEVDIMVKFEEMKELLFNDEIF